ncbi:MAG: hypothetical protein LBE53_06510 [Paucimonas sp.]|jgi:hypothetical protein|nr:hypothetical protein [Paucimonas sp.]
MGRPFNFPTPQSVTIGNPTMFVPADLVLSLYNQDSDNPKAINFSQKVREWFIREAYAVGWSNAGVDGTNSGILLVAVVNVIPHPSYPQLT